VNYDSNNIFARILRGEIPAAKVYEDDFTLAFMDAMPQADGHTLVIPKVEAENFFDIPDEALARLITTTRKVAGAVQIAFAPDGVMISQLNGQAAGQSVFHIHFHIIPRYSGTPLKGHGRGMADTEMLQQHAEKVRAALAD
jgi:histidine triad (HIT) family protein